LGTIRSFAAKVMAAAWFTEKEMAMRNPSNTETVAPRRQHLFPLHLLQPPVVAQPVAKEELVESGRVIVEMLSQFGIGAKIGDIAAGPAFTRFEFQLAPGLKMETVQSLADELLAVLKTDSLQVLAPVPHKSTVGIEVPNRTRTEVVLRDVLESVEWSSSTAQLPIALGRDINNAPVMADLALMPHLLVAGRTGTSTAACVDGIILSLLGGCTADELRLVMIDPVGLGLCQYRTLPHLATALGLNASEALAALQWVVDEIDLRCRELSREGLRSIEAFNRRATRRGEMARGHDAVALAKFPRVVVVIHELADVMQASPAAVETALARITQAGGAVGVHCVVATQRPSVDVVTGVVKANIPARIAFQLGSRVDSRTVLEAAGAEKLIGRGDMLYLAAGSAQLQRIEGCHVVEEEVWNVIDNLTQKAVHTGPAGP
jgi:S-DNA-T family DNA segregation ATPase FtsK/SpoIIIE